MKMCVLVLSQESHSHGLVESYGALLSGGGERWEVCRGFRVVSRWADQDTVVASGPRIHCLESDDRRWWMTLGQAFFLCADEVERTRRHEGEGGASWHPRACTSVPRVRAASGDEAVMMSSPHG